ncbi:hypothetical protein PR202_gb22109 [Eleusine coracana subsp. coracana]|uniref:Uncharacterized protein n=1 Tax=Eleusine coracana subsp. coracana TaxID=191504 RepID=A0AAV5FEV7_ELECO|nr:hypothetical protein PR202_gb22109 [Eleusine coracana subsp. coracana]
MTSRRRCAEHDGVVPEEVARHHEHDAAAADDACCSAVVQVVPAPAAAVWSVVRRFDEPQAYKRFVRSCAVVVGDGGVGTLRDVRVVSGIPAASSRERLEILDDDRHVKVEELQVGDHGPPGVGDDHRRRRVVRRGRAAGKHPRRHARLRRHHRQVQPPFPRTNRTQALAAPLTPLIRISIERDE